MKKSDGSWDKFDDYVIDFALDSVRKGERIALVTLVKIEGSSPRSLGAQMTVSENGEWVGYLSGGCLERAIVEQALLAIKEGTNRIIRYGRGSKFIDIQLPCGGAIEFSFDVGITEEDLALVDARLHSRQCASMKVSGNANGVELTNIVRQYQPRRRLLVAGIGPAAIQLVKLGETHGFETALFSPDLPTREEAIGNGVMTSPMNGVGSIPDFKADNRTAIVLMFHDHEWERTLIPAALETNAFYIGAMGSRRTHRERIKYLTELGHDPVKLSRIRGPAGIFSGAKSAPDIALSILAEIVQMERGNNIPDVIFTDYDAVFACSKDSA